VAPVIRLAKRGVRLLLSLGMGRDHQALRHHSGRGVLLALLLVLSGCASDIQQPPVGAQAGMSDAGPPAPNNPARDYVVATWNVAWATRRPDTIPPTAREFVRSPATWRRTQDFAIGLGADIVALQEVDGVPIARLLLPPSAGFGGWRTTATDGPNETQRVVIVTRSGIPVQVQPDLSSIGGGFLRSGLDSTIMLDERPLRVLVLHLKAFCDRGQLTPAPPSGDCEQLARQIPHIVAWIEAQRAEGTAYMVLGDFNRELGESGDEVWRAFRQADPELRLIQQRETGNCPAGNGGIDNILLGGPATGWVVAGSQRGIPLPAPSGAIGLLSDHCPLLITLRPR
jgi:endonuclease/exonuclease/phosphatase family metal-dependent hydrolase